jgi:hypothetical protein
MKSKLVRRRASIKDLEEIIKIQCSPGNWNYDPYMQGLANGMLLSLNVATDDPREPVFMEAPKVWLADTPMDPSLQPVTVQGGMKTATEYTDEDLEEWRDILGEETFDIPAALVERMVKLNKLSFEWKLNKRILLLNDDVYLSYDKADHTFYYIDDIKDWVFSLSNDEMIDYVGEPDDIYNSHIGASLNDFKKNPSEVYHYTTPDGLEGIKEEGELRGGSGTGMTNRYASGVFTSVDPEEYADGTYGTICIDIDLPGFMREHPDTHLSFEPEVEECLLRESLVGALGLEDVNVEPDNSGGISYQTIIVGASIPVEFLSVGGQPLGDAEGKMASKTAGERLRLDEIYDKEQLEDPSEALHQFISPEDLDVAFPVKTMQPSEVAKLETFRDTSTIMEMYEACAGPKQKKIVRDKMKRFDASRVIVIAGTTLLDGYHHAIAAIKLNKPVRYINIYDAPEGHKVTASSPGLPRVIKEVSRQEVMEAENAANSKGKHENNPYRTFYTADNFGYGRDSATFYLIEVPIKLLNHQYDPEDPNSQPLSDATNARIDDYASRETKAPPVLITYAPRKWPTKYGKGLAFVANGNHRVEAARRAGKTTVEAYMPSNDYDFWVGTVLAAEDGPLGRAKTGTFEDAKSLADNEDTKIKTPGGHTNAIYSPRSQSVIDYMRSSNIAPVSEKLTASDKQAEVEWDMSPVGQHKRGIKLTYKGKKGPDFLIYIFPQADKSLDAEVHVITDAGETDKPYTPWVEAKDTQLATAQALATKIRECMDQEYNTRADAARRAGNRLLAQELQREASNIYQEVLNDIITQLVDIPNAKWTGWKVPNGD